MDVLNNDDGDDEAMMKKREYMTAMIILLEPKQRFLTLHNLKLSHFLPIYKLLQREAIA